ncbi:sensor histidine kinase [Tengunoibacter tsumagoiensis]|nr:PAS domain S-box protein [Tengunoibacter tsumagoiensis]
MTTNKQPEEKDSVENHVIQDLYYTIFEQSTVSMACVYLDGEIHSANVAFKLLFGLTDEDLRAGNLHNLNPPEQPQVWHTYLNRLLTEGKRSYAFEQQFVQKDSEIFWARVRASHIQVETGTRPLFLCTFEDISVRKSAEAERVSLLQHTQAIKAAHEEERSKAIEMGTRLKALFSAITEPIIFFDQEGRVQQINEAAKYLFGWPQPQKYEGVPFYHLTENYTFHTPDGKSIPHDQIPMYRILHGETIPHTQAVDIVITEPEGQQLALSVSGAPVSISQGAFQGSVCVFRDVTETNYKRASIQKALSSLLTLVENLIIIPELTETIGEKDPFVTKTIMEVGQRLADLVQEILDCNHVALATLEAETKKLQLVGLTNYPSSKQQQFRNAFDNKSLEKYLETDLIDRLYKGETVLLNLKAQAGRARLRFGSPYLLLAPMSVGTQIVGIFVISQKRSDENYSPEGLAVLSAVAKLTGLIIEQVRLVNEWANSRANAIALEDTNARFDAFMSIASHELRTPLTTIKGNIQLAMRRLDTIMAHNHDLPEVVQEKLLRVKNPLEYAVHRVGVQDRMISDLLDTSRIRANKFMMIMHHHNIVEIVKAAYEDVKLSAPERQIMYHLAAEENLMVLADADRIGQVVNNYLTNALKYSPIDQPVELTITREDQNVRISVSDHGPGLSSEDQQRVWERFYRSTVVDVQYGSGVGLGLGLYLCRMIVEQHHGQIGLTSQQGKGSTFWFTLPLVDATREEATTGNNYSQMPL